MTAANACGRAVIAARTACAANSSSAGLWIAAEPEQALTATISQDVSIR